MTTPQDRFEKMATAVAIRICPDDEEHRFHRLGRCCPECQTKETEIEEALRTQAEQYEARIKGLERIIHGQARKMQSDYDFLKGKYAQIKSLEAKIKELEAILHATKEFVHSWDNSGYSLAFPTPTVKWYFERLSQKLNSVKNENNT